MSDATQTLQMDSSQFQEAPRINGPGQFRFYLHVCDSRHFRSICKFYYFLNFLQNGLRWPLWMTENHFRSHFPLLRLIRNFFGNVTKWSLTAILYDRKITFDRISRHFISIQNFQFKKKITKWPQAAILDDRKSLSIAFLTISNQYATCICFNFFYKVASGDHIGWPKITFDRISRHFRSIRNFHFSDFLTKRRTPAAILDDRKSLLIAFLAISYQYATFFKFYKMATGGHFLWPKITLDRIFFFFLEILSQNGHIGSPKSLSIAFLAISNQYATFFFFAKWRPVTILDDRKSLSIALLAISDQYATFFQNGRQWPFWMPIFC